MKEWSKGGSYLTGYGRACLTFNFTPIVPTTYEVTYKVVNGTWSDDSTTDKTETVQSGSKPSSVPTGMKAASGYTGGAWDTDPTGTTINGATTFTYTFTALPTYQVTYRVVNGTWSDDTTADKTETVQSGSTPASVPTGLKAASGYTGGAWDTNPAEATITGATTFTYTFTALPTYQVTYRVVNGTWSDDTTADKTETVQSGSKPASVPTVMKAASGYTGGAWDTDPTDATITGATTFTYTFTALPSYQVTYKVVNGTWSDYTTTDKTETVQSGSTPASVPTGMKGSQGFTGGAWDENPADATITGAKTFTYTFTAKQASTVTKAPTAKNLTYTGSAQELVTAGTASGGEMQYALGTATEATKPYTTSIPAKTDAGTYYVWYKVVGDENHNDTEPACVEVTINKANQTAPAAPTEAGKTINSITLNEIPNGEYKCDTGDWQTSPTFTGLTQNKTYTFRQRYAADANHNASAGSEETVIRTANHTHSFTYSPSNGTITATCNGAGTCSLTDNKATLTIAAPDNLTYDKSAKAAVITDANAIQGTAKVQYQTKSGDAYGEATETAPTNAGTYKASITVGGATASVEYTIAKADPTCTAPTGLTATYGQTLADVTLTNPSGNTAGTWAWADNTASVGNFGTNTFKASFVPTDTTNYNTKTNIDVSVTVGKANIAPTVSIEGWTYGEEANQPIVTGNTGNGEVTYLYKEKGASDMSCTDVAPTQAGEYTVKALIAETANYNGGEATADFTIAKAKVTITADDKAIMREAALKELTYKVDGKVADGDDLGIKVTSNVKPAVAGKYDIKIAYAENANYDVTTVDGIYTVTDRITANEKKAGKNKINSAAKATVNKNGSITAKWGAVANAEKFEIYAAYCGKNNKFKKIKTVKGNINSFDITKLGGKKLNTSKCLKVYVVAYRKVNGKYEKITKSLTMHIAGKANKRTNAKAIKVKKSSYTLKVNKTATIKPTLVLKNSKKKAVKHAAKFRYQSTNKAVATVDKNGKIKAVGKGTCTIYIFANNGKLKSVKVTVK